MQSHLTLQLVAAVTETITNHRLPHFCNWPIQYALANLITLPQGQVLRQSFSHYLVHFDLFEYLLNKDLCFNFAQKEVTIFVFMMFEGHSTFYDQEDNHIADVGGGSYHFGYNDKGNYQVTLKAGQHKFLLLTLRPDWFLREALNLEEFNALVSNYTTKAQSVYSLPYCRLGRNILQTIRKMLLQQQINREHFLTTINRVLIQLIWQYHKMLVESNYTTAFLHKAQAADIADFIQENFQDSIVDDISVLTKHFGVSEKQLYRLAKIAFDKPLHRHVIILRMDYAHQQLTTTNKPIYEIALLAGYNDPHYFSRAFKRYYNLSPGELRRLHI